MRKGTRSEGPGPSPLPVGDTSSLVPGLATKNSKNQPQVLVDPIVRSNRRVLIEAVERGEDPLGLF